MVIITKVPQIVLADISTELRSRQKPVFFRLPTAQGHLGCYNVSLSLRQGKGKRTEACGKD